MSRRLLHFRKLLTQRRGDLDSLMTTTPGSVVKSNGRRLFKCVISEEQHIRPGVASNRIGTRPMSEEKRQWLAKRLKEKSSEHRAGSSRQWNL